MSSRTVTAATVRILFKDHLYCNELLDQIGIPSKALNDPLARIPVQTMCLLWDQITRITKDPLIALHSAETVPFGTYRLLEYMIMVSSTPAEALKKSAQFFSLVNNAFELSYRSVNDVACLELTNPDDSHHIPRPYVEYIFSNYVMRLRHASQAICNPTELHVTYDQVPHLGEYHRVFRSPVRFCQPVNRLIFPAAVMKVDQPYADAQLCEVLEAEAHKRLTTIETNNTLIEVRRALATGFEKGILSLAYLSRELAKSPRTLQRELLARGTTFRELVDDMRRERATRLLKEKEIPLAEVARQLRFSDPSAFSRAFRRWTGKPPLSYKQQSN